MAEELLDELRSRTEKAVEGLTGELATIRVGRASPALLDGVVVDYQGSPTQLRQMASISAPDVGLLMVQPWDRGALRDIEKAILKSDLGLNPSNDGHIIRIVVPPLSEERRKELAKLVAKKVEERRVGIRNIRRDVIEKLRKLEKNKEMSQDDLRATTKKIDQLIDSCMSRLEDIGHSKEQELREV